MQFSRSLKKIMMATLLPSLVLGTLGMQGFFVARAAERDTCSTITVVSNTDTRTAGFTETNPSANPLQDSAYTPGTLGDAYPAQTVIPPWIDPATDPAFSGSGAIWISSAPVGPGDPGSTEGSAGNDQWRLFQRGFLIPGNATVGSSTIWYSTDNAAAVYLNGDQVASTNGSSSEDVFGPAPTSSPANYSQVSSASLSPTTGSNHLNFVVRNWGGDYTSNPTGLVFKAVINYCITASVRVTIDKYVDGQHATAASASSTEFPMTATWDAENIGSGTGTYTLGPTGFNSTSAYQAVTADMNPGADYSTNEVLDGVRTGASCGATSTPQFELLGYTTGNTQAQAANKTPTMTAPSFNNLLNSKHVIVWNRSCNASSTGTIGGTVEGGGLRVTSITAEKTTSTANGTFEDGWRYVFHITAPTSEEKLAMKFSDWVNGSGSSSIAVANNMRISSAQANSSGTVMLTAANTYSSPNLVMTGDLDSGLAGRQVDVLVEVRIPVGTVDGSYTTTYGVRTLP